MRASKPEPMNLGAYLLNLRSMTMVLKFLLLEPIK
jgi:hypothetical protein